MKPKAIYAGVSMVAFATIGGVLLAIASSWIGYPLRFVVAGSLLFAAIGYLMWSGRVRAWVAFGSLGCIFQPSLFPATVCDGQAYMWPVIGAVLGIVVGVEAERWRTDKWHD